MLSWIRRQSKVFRQLQLLAPVKKRRRKPQRRRSRALNRVKFVKRKRWTDRLYTVVPSVKWPIRNVASLNNTSFRMQSSGVLYAMCAMRHSSERTISPGTSCRIFQIVHMFAMLVLNSCISNVHSSVVCNNDSFSFLVHRFAWNRSSARNNWHCILLFIPVRRNTFAMNVAKVSRNPVLLFYKEQYFSQYDLLPSNTIYFFRHLPSGFYRKDHLRKHTRSHIARRVKSEVSAQSQTINGTNGTATSTTSQAANTSWSSYKDFW